MKPFVLQAGDIQESEVSVFAKVEKAVRAVPHGGLFLHVTCHEVSKAVSLLFPRTLEMVTGQFVSNWDHSWVEFKSRQTFIQGRPTQNRLIIDVYPWGAVGGPLMVLAHRRLPWGALYIREDRSPEPASFRKKYIDLLLEHMADVL